MIDLLSLCLADLDPEGARRIPEAVIVAAVAGATLFVATVAVPVAPAVARRTATEAGTVLVAIARTSAAITVHAAWRRRVRIILDGRDV